MAPKRDLSAKDAPSKKKARKSITLEQKMDILRRYNRGESTAAIHNMKEKENGPMPDFIARTGWFYKFEVRYGYHSVKRSGEAKSADEDAAVLFPDRLTAIIEGEGERGVQAPAGVQHG